MITLFCIRRAGEPGPPSGLTAGERRAVQLVESGPLGAWICEGELPRSLDGIRAHDAVVRRALRTATPAPVRFGTVFACRRDMEEALCEGRDEFLKSLARVEGRVEMGVRIEWLEESTLVMEEGSGAGVMESGREYLELRRRQLRAVGELRARAAALVAAVESRVDPRPCEAVHRLLPERAVAAVVAHLVQRQRVAMYRKSLEEARQAFPDVELHLTGPWAPYSFV